MIPSAGPRPISIYRPPYPLDVYGGRHPRGLENLLHVTSEVWVLVDEALVGLEVHHIHLWESGAQQQRSQVSVTHMQHVPCVQESILTRTCGTLWTRYPKKGHRTKQCSSQSFVQTPQQRRLIQDVRTQLDAVSDSLVRKIARVGDPPHARLDLVTSQKQLEIVSSCCKILAG